jgi:hypothetical protein
MKTMEKKVIEKKVMNGGGMFGLALSWLRDRHRRSVFSIGSQQTIDLCSSTIPSISTTAVPLLLSLVELLPTPPA